MKPEWLRCFQCFFYIYKKPEGTCHFNSDPIKKPTSSFCSNWKDKNTGQTIWEKLQTIEKEQMTWFGILKRFLWRIIK